MKKTILITGASSGIGQACAKVAATEGMTVFATARRKSHLQVLQKRYPKIQIITADISTETGRNHISISIKKPLDFVLHNAAILDSPQSFEELSLGDFRNNIVTNVEPILFLTQKLMPHFKSTCQAPRILSVSSGAAKTAIPGLAHYCVSKAAALMANQILKSEMPKYGVIVNDYFPGVVNTGMQKTLRSSAVDVFPYSDEFKKLNEEGKLSDPMQVASDILGVFMHTDDSKFIKSQWLYNGVNKR